MPLLAIPQEIILHIASQVDKTGDFFHLLQANRALYNLLIPELYKRAVNETNGRALLWYAGHGSEAGVQNMLDAGANVDFRPPNHFTKTALQTAVEAKHIGIVKLLLENGAQPNLVVPYKTRPLDAAIEGSPLGDVAMMTLLLDYGADVNFHNHRNRRQQTPLFTAVTVGDLSKTALLLARGADVHARESTDGKTPLHAAAFNSRTRTVKMLVVAGSEVNAVHTWGESPLMVAAQYGSKDCVQKLLDCGADVNFTSPNGVNALHKATKNATLGQSTPIMKLLLDYGLDVNSRDDRQQTPLHYASTQSWIEKLEALLNLGADLSARDEEGITVMHYAAQLSTPDFVRWFADHGADVNWSDFNGETPIFWSLKKCLSRVSLFQTLLDLNADTNRVNVHGQTLLFFAAHAWCPQTTSILLKLGADVNHRDGNGLTPLHWAVSSTQSYRDDHPVEVLKILIEHGADVNSRTLEGSTPLGMFRDLAYPQIRKCLANAGAIK